VSSNAIDESANVGYTFSGSNNLQPPNSVFPQPYMARISNLGVADTPTNTVVAGGNDETGSNQYWEEATTVAIDPATAQADISTVYNTLFNLANPALAGKVAVIQDGAGISTALQQALSSSEASASQGSKIDSINILTAAQCATKSLPPQCAHVVYDTQAGDATISIACLFAAAVAFGFNTPSLLAVGQALAGPRAGGKWMGFQNGIGNFAHNQLYRADGIIITRNNIINAIWSIISIYDTNDRNS